LWAITGPLFPIAFYSVTSGVISLKTRRLSAESAPLQVSNIYGVGSIIIGSIYFISGIVFRALIL